jgi:PDZ domain-containing protein
MRCDPQKTAVPVSDAVLDELAENVAIYKRTRLAGYVGSALVVIIVAVMALLPVPYIKFSPGPMYSTIGSVKGIELITIEDTTTYPTSGELDMTTVSERGGPFGGLTLPEAFVGWVDPDQTVAPVELFYPPDTSAQEAREENAADFTSSQSAAIGASLGFLDIPVTSVVLVAQVISTGPSAGKLQVNDIIRSVNGTTVTKPADLPPLVQAMEPGSTATFAITRAGKDENVDVVLGTSPRDPNKAYAGIAGGTEFAGPFPITFGLKDVGGPSAGLMFSLGIIDKLTPDEMSGGQLVAGTGTITSEGVVGPIGGLPQKLFAARDKGTAIFLAPAGNCDAVLESAPPELNVVKIETLAQAVDTLTRWRSGDTDLPRCS